MVGKGTSGGECYGTWSDSTKIGSGAGYVNPCIRSGSIAAGNTYDKVATNTVWYNYVAATAGTIKNSSTSDTTGNTTAATESVCPKGWTLPSKKQIDNNSNVADFNPTYGGTYTNSSFEYESTHGYWWGSEAYNGIWRYNLIYNGDVLSTAKGARRINGFYIRCVSEEKDVSDLTYMQDMTPSVAVRTDGK